VRIKAGERIVVLEEELRDRIRQVRTLQGLVPICMHCKKIRTDHNYWVQVEQYVGERTDARFSHGLCPDCVTTHYPTLAGAEPSPEAQQP
jgi:hypothetical protein